MSARFTIPAILRCSRSPSRPPKTTRLNQDATGLPQGETMLADRPEQLPAPRGHVDRLGRSARPVADDRSCPHSTEARRGRPRSRTPRACRR